MSSIVQRLTEGVVNRDMRAESHALLSKWKKTGLLEGLDGERKQNTMARLLENQAKELLREQTTLAAGDVEGFAAVAFPIVRRVFAGLIANDLVSVQPMSLPSGLIFFLDFTFSPDAGGAAGVFPRMGNDSGQSIYGGDRVAAQITGGVNLVDQDSKAGGSGPLRDGATGYAYSSPSGSNNADIPASSNTKTRVFRLNGSVSLADKKRIKFDPDLLSLTGTEKAVVVIDVTKTDLASDTGDPDFENLSPFVIANLAAADVTGLGGVTNLAQIRRLTDLVAATDSMNSAETVRFVFSVDQSDVAAEVGPSNLAVAL